MAIIGYCVVCTNTINSDLRSDIIHSVSSQMSGPDSLKFNNY